MSTCDARRQLHSPRIRPDHLNTDSSSGEDSSAASSETFEQQWIRVQIISATSFGYRITENDWMALKSTDMGKKSVMNIISSPMTKIWLNQRSARTGSGSCDTNFRLTAPGWRPDFNRRFSTLRKVLTQIEIDLCPSRPGWLHTGLQTGVCLLLTRFNWG